MTGPEIDAAQRDSFEGYAVPLGRYTARRVRGPKYFATLGLWVLILVLGMMVLALIDGQVDNMATRYACPPDCGRPPIGLPVAINPRFTAPDGSFSVAYPVPGAAYDVALQPNGVIADWTAGDGGTLRLFSEPANGRDAKQIAKDSLQNGFPDVQTAYELPNATVGFHLGYGEVADFRPIGTAGGANRLRLIIVVAVKNDLALIAAAQGPFRQFTPNFGPGPPSPANLQIAQDMGKYVNSFSWRDDPPR